MAESAVIECPPTPELVVNCPSTPPNASSRIRDFLKTQLKDSDSDDESRRAAAGSPPPNCSICLGEIKNKCFTDSCMHRFCFSCLLEWSKVINGL